MTIANNNPGNLRPIAHGQLWEGQTGVSEGFCVFDTQENGLRALAKDLVNQQRLHDLHTVAQIITKYAPPEDDNDTTAYIAAICSALGVAATDPVNLEDAGVLERFVTAVVWHEEGQQPYSVDLIAAASTEALTKSA